MIAVDWNVQSMQEWPSNNGNGTDRNEFNAKSILEWIELT